MTRPVRFLEKGLQEADGFPGSVSASVSHGFPGAQDPEIQWSLGPTGDHEVHLPDSNPPRRLAQCDRGGGARRGSR